MGFTPLDPALLDPGEDSDSDGGSEADLQRALDEAVRSAQEIVRSAQATVDRADREREGPNCSTRRDAPEAHTTPHTHSGGRSMSAVTQ